MVKQYDQYDSWDLTDYRDSRVPSRLQAYSLASIVFMDGTTTEFMVKAAPSVVPHLVKEMKNTGFLTLWNDIDTMCIRADIVKCVSMREVTKQQEK
jgi:hypothetical protein